MYVSEACPKMKTKCGLTLSKKKKTKRGLMALQFISVLRKFLALQDCPTCLIGIK